jgi:hypothetical protein
LTHLKRPGQAIFCLADLCFNFLNSILRACQKLHYRWFQNRTQSFKKQTKRQVKPYRPLSEFVPFRLWFFPFVLQFSICFFVIFNFLLRKICRRFLLCDKQPACWPVSTPAGVGVAAPTTGLLAGIPACGRGVVAPPPVAVRWQ